MADKLKVGILMYFSYHALLRLSYVVVKQSKHEDKLENRELNKCLCLSKVPDSPLLLTDASLRVSTRSRSNCAIFEETISTPPPLSAPFHS